MVNSGWGSGDFFFFFLLQKLPFKYQETGPDKPKAQSFMSSTVVLERTCMFSLHIEIIIVFGLGAEQKRTGRGEQESLDATVGLCLLSPPPNHSGQQGLMLHFIPGTLRRHSLSKSPMLTGKYHRVQMASSPVCAPVRSEI